MRAFAFAAASLALVIAVSASPVKEERNGLPVVYDYQPGDKCPAERFYNDCNYCFCSQDGYSAGCQRMACPPRSSHNIVARSAPAEYPRNDLFGQTGQCKPDVYFMWECNLCHCGPNGDIASCTDIACREVEKPRIDEYQMGDKCVPGKTFYDRCNSCTCGADGKSAECTLIACPKEQ